MSFCWLKYSSKLSVFTEITNFKKLQFFILNIGPCLQEFQKMWNRYTLLIKFLGKHFFEKGPVREALADISLQTEHNTRVFYAMETSLRNWIWPERVCVCGGGGKTIELLDYAI